MMSIFNKSLSISLRCNIYNCSWMRIIKVISTILICVTIPEITQNVIKENNNKLNLMDNENTNGRNKNSKNHPHLSQTFGVKNKI